MIEVNARLLRRFIAPDGRIDLNIEARFDNASLVDCLRSVR